jgi:hypothetical protein
VLKVPPPAVGTGGGERTRGWTATGWSSTGRFRCLDLPRPGGGEMCCSRICFASASERVNDLSHSMCDSQYLAGRLKMMAESYLGVYM